MQQQSKGIPSLPGVTRLAKAQTVAATSRDVEMRQRKFLARGLAAGALVLLIASIVVNVAFLVISCFLVFGAFIIRRPPTKDVQFLRESPSSHIEGTIAYDLKWGNSKDRFKSY